MGMAKGKDKVVKPAKAPKKDGAAIAAEQAKAAADDKLARARLEASEEASELNEKIELLEEKVDASRRALGVKASAVRGLQLYSVAVFVGDAHFATYLGVATDSAAAQAVAEALAVSKGAEGAVVASCNVVGRIDFA